MNKPTDSDMFENDVSKAARPHDRPAPPSAADGKNQPWYQELRNELRGELLDKKAAYIDRWLAATAIMLTFFGIFIGVTGYMTFEEFDKLEKDISGRFGNLENEINERFGNLETGIKRTVQKAERFVEETKVHRDEAKKIVRGISAETVTNAPEKAVQAVVNIGGNPEASVPDKAIARAVALQQQGRKKEAIKEWGHIAKLAERIDDDLAERAWYSIGYLSQDPYAKILAYDKVIRLKPDNVFAYSERGFAKNKLGRNEEALVDLDEAIRLDPTYAKAYNNRGVAMSHLGHRKHALADFNEAIRLDPADAIAYNNRGYENNKLGQYEAARVDFNEEIRLKPDLANPYNHRGYAENKLGQYEAAMADFNEAIHRNPDYDEAYYNRGLLKAEKGLKKEARKDLKTALELARKTNDSQIVDKAEQSLRELGSDEGS